MTRPEFENSHPANKVSRRDFIVTALSAGFALAAQPITAQMVIKTDLEGLVADEIKIESANGALVAYRAMPAGGDKLPTVLVIHEIFGVHEYIKDICRRLAKAGYLAIAAEMYARHGNVGEMGNIQEILAGPVAAASDAEHMADLDACAAWAAQNGGDPERLAVAGFCRGGRTAWLYAAHNPRLKAAAAWYGPLTGNVTPKQPKWPLTIAAELKAPVLGLYGGQDTGIPLDQVEEMAGALRRARNKYRSQIHIYPEGPHAFHADYRPSYRKEIAEDAWRRMLEWFAQHKV